MMRKDSNHEHSHTISDRSCRSRRLLSAWSNGAWVWLSGSSVLSINRVSNSSRLTGKPHLAPVSLGCCSRARVCLDRRSETQIFVDPVACRYRSRQSDLEFTCHASCPPRHRRGYWAWSGSSLSCRYIGPLSAVQELTSEAYAGPRRNCA